MAKLLQNSFEGEIHILVLHRNQRLHYWLHDVSLGAVLFNKQAQGLHHDCVLLVVVTGAIEGLALLNQDIQDFQGADLGLFVLGV